MNILSLTITFTLFYVCSRTIIIIPKFITLWTLPAQRLLMLGSVYFSFLICLKLLCLHVTFRLKTLRTYPCLRKWFYVESVHRHVRHKYILTVSRCSGSTADSYLWVKFVVAALLIRICELNLDCTFCGSSWLSYDLPLNAPMVDAVYTFYITGVINTIRPNSKK